MDQAEFLERIRNGRQKLNEAISGLSEDQIANDLVTPDWALRDLLAHLAAWQGEALRWVEQAAYGEEIVPLINQSVDEWNARRVEERRRLPVVEVMQEFNENHDHLLAALEKWPADTVPLGPGMWDETANIWWLTEHDEEHLPMIADYRRRLAASATVATDREEPAQ
jgi:tRNA nucleotidyltransferase/poly(A) polymerase